MSRGTFSELFLGERSFRKQTHVPAREDLHLGARWAKATIRSGCNDDTRFSGDRFDRIVAKVRLLRQVHAQDARSAASRALQDLFSAVKDDRAIARFFMARVAEPEILDVPSFAAAAALATRKPWLNALRADIIGVYKIFTQFVRNGQVVDGSYTGEATRQTIASRSHQHAAMFEAASAADLAGQRLNQRQLYNATTLPTRHQLLVTTCHVPELLLEATWTYHACCRWPLELAHIHLVTISLDEMLVCAEFQDLTPFPSITSVEQKHCLPRQLVGLNGQWPGVQRIDDQSRLAVSTVIRTGSHRQEQEMASMDNSRLLLGLLSNQTGMPMVWHGDRAKMVIQGGEWWANCSEGAGVATDTTAQGFCKLVCLTKPFSGYNGSPLALREAGSQLLDCRRVVLTKPSNVAGFCPSLSCANHSTDDWADLLDMLHWVAARQDSFPAIKAWVRQPKDDFLGAVAVRVKAAGGCGLLAVREGAGWKVQVPRWDVEALTRFFGAVEQCEEDIGQWWVLPTVMQPPSQDREWAVVVHVRGDKPEKLAYIWQDVERPAEIVEHAWRNIPGDKTPEYRFFVNLVRWGYGLTRIGRAVGRGAPPRVGKDGQTLSLAALE